MSTDLVTLQRIFTSRHARPKESWLREYLQKNTLTSVESAWTNFLSLPLSNTSYPCLPSEGIGAHKVTLSNCILELAGIDEIGYSRQKMIDACTGPLRPGGVREPRELLKKRETDDDQDSDDDDDDDDDPEADETDHVKETDKGLPRGTLKLTLTDGMLVIYGLEYERIPALDILMPIGSKILIIEAEIRRGVALLKANQLRVLRRGRHLNGTTMPNNTARSGQAHTTSEDITKEELQLRLQIQLNQMDNSSTAQT